MDPVTLVTIPGFLGGIVLAVVFMRLQRGSLSRTDPFTREPISTDVINAARIRVSGIGGLGLVAMATVVAVSVPRIGVPLAAGLVMGVLLAVALIVLRSRSGPMPSSGQQPGANTTLSIDAPALDADAVDRDGEPKARTVTPVP